MTKGPMCFKLKYNSNESKNQVYELQRIQPIPKKCELYKVNTGTLTVMFHLKTSKANIISCLF